MCVSSTAPKTTKISFNNDIKKSSATLCICKVETNQIETNFRTNSVCLFGSLHKQDMSDK